MCLDLGPQRGGHQVGVKVGANGEYDVAVGRLGQAQQRALEGVHARTRSGEQLFELVHHQEQVPGITVGGQQVVDGPKRTVGDSAQRIVVDSA